MKTGTVVLGDDKEYTMTTLNVKDLIEIQDKFKSISVDSTQLENVVYWIYLSIRKHHKDMTLDQLYELLDAPFIATKGFEKIFEVMSKLNGWDTLPKNAPSPVQKA